MARARSRTATLVRKPGETVHEHAGLRRRRARAGRSLRRRQYAGRVTAVRRPARWRAALLARLSASPARRPRAPVVCGNGATEFGETCDDGNTASNDGCSKTCQTEAGYTCNGATCTLNAACGDGTLNSGEQCDDGNKVPGDCCNGACGLESNCKCSTPASGVGPQVCVSTIVCGDGAVTGDEACDDGNAAAARTVAARIATASRAASIVRLRAARAARRS